MCTFTTELPDIQTLKLIGDNNLMFGSDFPHNESFYPKTNTFLKKIKKIIENHHKYLFDNTISNYNLSSKF